MTIRLAIATLVLTFSIGCVNSNNEVTSPDRWSLPKTGAVTKPYQPMKIGAAEEVHQVCARTLGVSCALGVNQLTLTIDQTGTPEETQRGVSFMSTYYCRLTRLEGQPDNTVLLVRPDGSQVGRSCTKIGTTTE